MNLVRLCVSLFIYMLCLATPARGQCGILLQDDAPPSDGTGHRTLFEWDFDGPGPLEPELLIGTDAGRIIAYNGSRWRQVGNRLSGLNWGSTTTDPVAFKFVNFRGELYVVASGMLSSTQGALFRWDGTSWVMIPMTGNGCSGQGVAGWMIGATVWNDQIVVVGQNLRCGQTTTMALAWNGTSWSTLGNLFTNSHSIAVAAAVHATSDGRLLLGGTIPTSTSSTIIAELVDGAWITRATGNGGTGGIVTANFQEIDGQLFALTSYAFVTGQGSIPVGVLREGQQTGIWTAWHIATDADSAATSGSQLAKVGNTWYLAASRDTTQGVILRRDGEGPWTRCDQYGGYPSRMRGIALYKDSLIAIGSATANGFCDRFGHVYQSSLAQPAAFYALPSRFSVLYNSPVQQIGAIIDTSDGLFGWLTSQTPATGMYIARWPQPIATQCSFFISGVSQFDGRDWTTTSEPLNGPIRDMITFEDQILGFGSFTAVGARPLSANVARWTGGRWEPFDAGFSGAAHSSVIHQGDLLASSSGSAGSTVLRWTPPVWTSLSQSLTLTSALLISTGSDLFAYGLNTSSMFKLEGNAWVSIPSPGQPYSDADTSDGNVYVSLSGSTLNPVKRLENNAWVDVGTFPAAAIVRSIAWHQGELYAGVQYPAPPGTAPLMVYRNGSWVPAIPTAAPRTGLNHPTTAIFDMFSSGDTLHLVGNFSYIGGLTAESWIRFYTGAPRILTQPIPSEVTAGQTAYFSIEPEVYHDPLQTFQWHRDGLAISNGLTSTGSTIAGATTPYLRIANISAADLGLYTVKITNGCGITESTPGELRFPPPYCPADFDQDGSVTGSDVEAFFLAWEAGSPQADINLDGGTDGTDVQAFFILWEAGGC